MLIFSFHMPLFFFISGMLHGASRGTPAEVIRRKARTLLVPYLFFFGLSLAYLLATRHLGERARQFQGVVRHRRAARPGQRPVERPVRQRAALVPALPLRLHGALICCCGAA